MILNFIGLFNLKYGCCIYNCKIKRLNKIFWYKNFYVAKFYIFICSISIKYYKILIIQKNLNNFMRMVENCIKYNFKRNLGKKIILDPDLDPRPVRP